MLLKISIHASTRGATINRRECRAVHAISIHASTRGATGKAGTDVSDMLFQSTLPREERRISTSQTKLLQNFNPRFHERSDHAQFFSKFLYLLYFNPRFHERSDESCFCCGYLSYLISIHASTRGATVTGDKHLMDMIFQSTLPREERRSQSQIIGFCIIISIHASTRGATVRRCQYPLERRFQSTLPREERHLRAVCYRAL